MYSTIQGDTWDSIAKKIYGSESYMSFLIEANQKYMDYVIFPAGIQLETPELPEDVTLAANLPPWKR